MKGIDISRHDGYPLKAVPKKAFAESDFVIIKATQGTSYKYTSYFYSQITLAEKSGKLLGAYHYAAGGDPKREAAYFLSVVKKYIGKAILCLDWESMQNKAWGSKSWCKTFIDYVKAKTGITCFLYTGLDGCKQNEALAGKVPLWFAGYPDSRSSWSVPTFEYNTSPWKYTMWQYTSSGEKCDRNTTALTKAQWLKYAKGNITVEKNLRQEVVNTLLMLEGIREGSAEHKMILRKFNESGLCPRYKMTAKDAWCATTVSFAFIVNKLAGKPGSGALFQCVECSCAEMVKLGKQQGIFVESDSYTPKPGDVIFYDWQDFGKGDDKGHPDHVGIVISVSGGIINVIEGNKADAIGRRKISVNGRYIRGFICPKYADPADTREHYPGKLPILPARGYFKKGDGMVTLTGSRDQIKRVQTVVNWVFDDKIPIKGKHEKLETDGKYGEKTDAAVSQMQKKFKLPVNGCYGDKCQKAIKAYRK